MNRPTAFALAFLIFAAGCAAPARPRAEAVETASLSTAITTTATPSQVPSQTPRPAASPAPTRTPRPSPTLPSGPDFNCLPSDGQRQSGIVAGVIDGDTIRVQIGPQNFTVRYIGLDAPETNLEPPERFGPEATRRNRELVSGKRVTLVSDPGVGETDRYDRLLRYVVTEDLFVNAILVREGLARYAASPGAGCGSLLFDAEETARAAQTGLWIPSPSP